MRLPPTAVYIDTEVFYTNGFKLNTKDFKSMVETFVKGGLRLLVPEMMERELIRHYKKESTKIADMLINAHKYHPGEDMSLPELPDRSELEERGVAALNEKWDQFKSHFKVEHLPLVGSIENVVDWYLAVEPPFEKGKKEKEFPDAFIVSALDSYHQQHSANIAVISRDGGFAKACGTRRYLTHFNSLSDYVSEFLPRETRSDIDAEEIDPTKPIATEDLTELKALIGRGSDATELERSRVLDLLSSRGTNYEYFFQNAGDQFWFNHLKEKGFFRSPPNIELIGDDRYTIPFWHPLLYLKRIVGELPGEVVNVLKSIPATDNPRVLEGICEIAASLEDVTLSVRLKAHADALVESSYRWSSHEVLSTLLVRWVNGTVDSKKAGLLLTQSMVSFKPDPEAEDKAQKRKEDTEGWFTSLEPTPKFDPWEYQQILENGVRPLAEKHPLEISRIFIEATASMIRLSKHRDELEKENDWDGFGMWCPQLDQSQRLSEGAKEALVHTMTFACEKVYEGEPDSVGLLDELLRNQRWRVFKRLRQHLYAKFPSERTLPWIQEFILAHDDYSKWEHGFEFQQLIQNACDQFKGNLLSRLEFETIYEAILSGPSKEHFQEQMGDHYSDENWAQRQGYFQLKQLHPFASVLHGRFREHYQSLCKKHPDAPRTNESYLGVHSKGGTVTYRSPFSKEELLDLNDSDLLARINEWDDESRDPDNWLIEINVNALASVFGGIFKEEIIIDEQRLDWWLSHKDSIKRPVYVSKMLEAMRERVEAGEFNRMNDWLGFCRWALEKPNPDCPDKDFAGDESGEQPVWRHSRRTVCEFVEKCLDKEAKVQTPLKARKDLADLLEKLCTEFDWRLDRDNPVLLNCDDQITEAINNTRSRALQALVSFGNWVRRHDENAAVPEIAAILDARFKDDAKHPLTLPERAILGMEFGRIWNLDSKWAVTHKNQFFPQEDIDVWCEAFGNFIRYNRPYEPFFEMLKGDFEFALEHLNDLEKKKSIGRDVVDTLGQHLFTYYLWDVYPLRGEDSFLKLFFEKTTKEKKHWASLFNHVGHILRNTEKLQVRLLEPVKTYFDWRLKVGDPKELRQFTHWLEAKCLEPDWRLDGYLKILEKSADEEVHGISIELEALGSLLESHLGKVVECFAKITESLTEKNSWKVQTKNAQPILQAGLNSADETIQKNAERARENLLKLGRFDFLDE